jgi:UDP-N-acetylglucosamine 2-epimerase (non-hydrolysing)
MFIAELDIRADSDLNLMQSDQSPTELSGRLIPAITELFRKQRPDLVLVQGDTTSAALSALAAFYEHIYVGHVEAGLRSGNRCSPFPEEVNRRMVAALADIHFAPTEQARLNLLSEGVAADHVYITGNPIIDAVRAIGGGKEESKSPRLLMTVHRRENFGEPMQQIFHGIRIVAEKRPQLEIVYPVHPNPNVYGLAYELLGGVSNIHLCAPMGYRDFVSEMQKAWFIVSDSGGVQEEATALGKPMLLLRRETERPEGIEAGNIRQVRLDAAAVAEEIELLLDDAGLRRSMMKVSDVYGDGHAAERIIEHCLTFLKQHAT